MSFNQLIRKELPRTKEINSDFLRDYLTRTGKSNDDDRVADDDATFGRLIRWLLGSTFPPTHTLDCAIRVGMPQHSALPSLIIRHFIQFTLLYGLCLVFNAVHPVLALKVEGAYVSAIFLLACIGCLAAEDTSLFFHRVGEAFQLVAFVGIILVASPSTAVELLIAFAMTLALTVMLSLSLGRTVADLMAFGFRLLLIVVLVHALPRAGGVLALGPSLTAAILVATNFVALLPIPTAMQHWYAAHPYVDLEDVRSYGPSAPLYWGNRRAAIIGLLSYLIATFTAAAVVALFIHFGIAFYSTSAHKQPDFDPLLRLCGTVAAAALFNFTLFELIVHRRLVTVGRFLASYYSTWRALAAWLSSNPLCDYPTIFQFVRPWANRSMRLAVVTAALAAHTAFTVNWLTIWSVQAYQASFPAAGMSQAAATPDEPSTPHFGTQFWVTLFTAAVFLPPVMFFLMLHASWGPSFQAFTDRFETFDQRTTPPLLAVSLRASLRRILTIIFCVCITLGN